MVKSDRLGNSVIYIRYFSLFMLFIIAKFGYSQPTIVSGRVTDADTGLPIPYVNIVFMKSQIGTITDTLGNFYLSSKDKFDSVQFSTVSYVNQTFAITPSYSNKLQVSLKSEVVNVDEVTVYPDEGPIRAVIKAMVDRKNQNNPAKHDRYSYQKYTKWEYHIHNIDEKMMKSRAFRNDQSVFKIDADTSRYLPIYFSEQLVFNEYQRNPLKQKSTVLADRTSGVGMLDDFEISGYTSALDMEVNFYDNYINLFYQNFVSPIADNGWFYYKYFLSDSTIVNGHKQYRIRFIPRRLGDKVFKGYMITDDENFSLIEVDGVLANTEYLNFLKSMRLKCNYQYVNDSVPFYRRNQIDAVFDYIPMNYNPSKKKMSLYFSQSSVIDSVTVNQPGEVTLSLKNSKFETVKLPNATERDKMYWDNMRLEELNQREKDIASTIDSVSSIKAVKILDNLTRMGMTGYYDLGKFEFGPYPNIFNTNKVEGMHLFAGARTSSEISTRFMVWGGLGYGFRNQKINGMGGVGFKLPTIRRQLVKFSYDDKIVRSGENEKILLLYENMLSPTENNIVSQVLKRDHLDELYREQKLSANYEFEWYPGLLNKVNANYITHYSPEFYPFLLNGNKVGNVSAFDLSIDTRFSWQEKVIDDKFLRVYMSTDYPIVHIALGGGNVYSSGKNNYYGRVYSTLQHSLMIGQTSFNYALEGGIYFGKLPYTMLDIPRGNESYGYYLYDFNMLNYLEFVHDRYLHGYFEYHLNGFIFNKLPLLKRSKLREVFSAKVMVGSLNKEHEQILEFPMGIRRNTTQYLEVGAGLENILRLFRIEAVWRVTPQSLMGSPSFGLRAKIEVKL